MQLNAIRKLKTFATVPICEIILFRTIWVQGFPPTYMVSASVHKRVLLVKKSSVTTTLPKGLYGRGFVAKLRTQNLSPLFTKWSDSWGYFLNLRNCQPDWEFMTLDPADQLDRYSFSFLSVYVFQSRLYRTFNFYGAKFFILIDDKALLLD